MQSFAPGRLLIGAALLEAGAGGIARVARMSARALIEAGAQAELLSFLDSRPIEIAGRRAHLAHRAKLRYALLAHWLARRADYALYDSVGVARAHPRQFFSPLPHALWIYGREAWEAMRADHLACTRRADLVFVCSRYTLARHEAAHGALPRAQVCWLATEDDDPPPRLAQFDGPPTVLIVARIQESEGGKGHDKLIDSWPQVVAGAPDARLVIVGGGDGLSQMQAKVARMGMSGHIEFRGHVREEELPALYSRAHVYAMPSRQDGFGIAYVEAMRHGLPLISSTDDAGQEVNVHGETGFAVPRDEPQRLVEALTLLLQRRELCAEIGGKGHARWRTDFRYSCFANRFLEIWSEFSRRRAARTT
jgi:phosphatidyl-myo-inositol dimannoside synthase